MDKHISQGCSRIESLQNDEEVKCIVEINKDTYFYWFIDYSACFFNAKGERIEAPINEFDFILDFKTNRILKTCSKDKTKGKPFYL